MNRASMDISGGQAGTDLKWIRVLMVTLLSVLIGCLSVFYPDSFVDVTLPMFWAFVLMAALYHLGRRSRDDRWLKMMVFGGLLIRFPVVLAHLAVGFWVYKGELDFLGYFGSIVARAHALMEGSFYFEVPDLAAGMSGRNVVSGLLTFGYFLVGPSLPGMFLITGVLGFLGSYLFLRAFQVEFPSSHDSRFLAASLFFFPSLAFWTSLLGKDSVIFFCLGLTSYSLAHVLKAVRLRYVLGLIVGVAFATFIRPPVGVSLILGLGVSLIQILRAQAPAMLRPLLYIVAGFLIVRTVIIMDPATGYLPFSSDESMSFAEKAMTAALHKHAGPAETSLAGLRSSSPAEITEASTFVLVRHLPELIFTFLFRPHVFEAHNTVAFIAAVDSTLLGMVILWRWKHLLAAIRWALARPFVAFCATTFLLATVGLSFEANFGIIVRHRTMVLPFLFILLVVPRRKPASSWFHGHESVDRAR